MQEIRPRNRPNLLHDCQTEEILSRFSFDPPLVVGYVASFFALSLALGRGVPLGIAYAIWSAVGVAAIAIISWVFFKESLTWVQIAGLVLVIGGVGLLELGACHPA
ncbi:DMT family transporter [Leifsonia sp. RAF41]|uniref:DMT family transporter n=1 Tax=Leifsonia sp. RAF41 TaxID=3233056 RepID=UPI003F998466